MIRTKDLEGAWEEPGVIGTRIEIKGKSLTVLWRNYAVLETAYKLKTRDGGAELELSERGLKERDGREYASVTSLFYKEGALTFKEHFPISGESVTVLKKTLNTRYGNCEIVDKELLPALKGAWAPDNEYEEKIVIKGDKLTMGAETIKIHAVRYRDGSTAIINADPAVYGVVHFASIAIEGNTLRAHLEVCDAPQIYIIFKKQ